MMMDKIKLGMKLDIGSGSVEEGGYHPDSSYVLQDGHEFKGIDIVCDIKRLDYELTSLYFKKFGEGRCDVCSEIRAGHILEHFHERELKENILPMLYKCLQDKGLLDIIVPNFVWHSQLVLQGNDEQAVKYCFGGGLDEYDFHKTGWTPKLAIKWLTEAGFIVESIEADSCIYVKARKK
jgi:predicted SAM-dependent methyltransferase